MDKIMVFNGKRVDKFADEGDLEDIVYVVYHDLACDQIIIEIDILIVGLVVGHRAFSSAVLAKVGVTLLQKLYIVHVFVAPVEMGFRGHVGMVQTQCGVVGGLYKQAVAGGRLRTRGGYKKSTDRQVKAERFGY
jgi:hypothetical protein